MANRCAGEGADGYDQLVAALDDVSREVHVISAYEPDQEHFEANKRIRRHKS